METKHMITEITLTYLTRLMQNLAIKIRKNASTRSKGCPLRRDEVLLLRKLGYDGWKDLKDAGRRWILK